MANTRVFVSYAFVDEQQLDYQFAQRLANDLHLSGANVAIDEANAQEHGVMPHMMQMLSTYQWLLVILTPEALQSPRVHMTINSALNLVAKGRMKGLLAIIAASCNVQEMPLAWRQLTLIDATQDYSRALARVLLELDGGDSISASETRSNPIPYVEQGADGSASGGNDKPMVPPPLPAPLYNRAAAQDVPYAPPSYPVIARHSFRFWLSALSVAMALLLILVSAGLLSAHTSRKTPTAATIIEQPIATPTTRATSISTTKPHSVM